MQLDYTVKSGKPFGETVDVVVRETSERGFRVLAVHDVAATLAEKGFDRAPVTIIEMCNAGHASRVLEADIKIGLLLPCPIMVYAEAGDVFITTMKPTLIASFFPDADLGDVPSVVEKAIVDIMDSAAR